MARVIKTETVFEGNSYEQYVVIEQEDPQPWPDTRELCYVGKPHARVDGPERVTGRATYTHDIQLRGMLHGRILRSPHPHARITRLDTSRAEALPGVRAVVSHLNAPDIPWFNKKSRLFDTQLRYVGDEIAAVAADTPEIAREAVALIEVEYEQLPFVTDPEQAVQPDAPKLYPHGNTRDSDPAVQERGSVEQGFREAEVVVEGRYTTPAQVHHSLETHGSVVHWEGDHITIWDSTPFIFGVRQRVAESLGLPQNRVRVIKKFMGGGFGSKNGTGKYTVIAALLSKQTRRPVKLVLDRREEATATGHRNQTVQYIRLGAKRDGTLTGIELRVLAGVGAYGGRGSVGGPARELYACPNVRTEEYEVYTNLGAANAFRAPGYVEGTFALESAMDELAAQLDIDPVQLRLKNYAHIDPATGEPFTLKQLDQAYEWARGAIEAARSDADPAPGLKRGVGMASQIWSGGGGPPAHAVVKVNGDGSATVISGTQDVGTGTKTMLVQIAAEELGLRIADVNIELGDTQDMPYAPISAGSMTTPSVGPAVRMAALEARKLLLDVAGDLMETPADELTVFEGEVFNPSQPQNRKSVRGIMQTLDSYMIIGKGSRGPNPEGKSLRTFGAQFVEVEVDTETGRVRVLNVAAAHESGRVINPLGFGSQIEGGVIQGIGLGITEERIVDARSGKVLNANLEEYKIPTSMDIPNIEHHGLEGVDVEANSIGAKGIGEPPIIPTPAAIANAVYDATGIRMHDLPITPERMLEALAAKEARR